MPAVGGPEEEAQSVYKGKSKKELKKESKWEWEWEAIFTMDGEQYRSKAREAIQGGGKKLKQKQGSSEKEK